jgi:hypothetical protein
MLLSLTSPHEMPGRSLPVWISLSWRLSRAAAGDVVDAMAASLRRDDDRIGRVDLVTKSCVVLCRGRMASTLAVRSDRL